VPPQRRGGFASAEAFAKREGNAPENNSLLAFFAERV